MTPEVATILVHRRKSTNDSTTITSNGNGPTKTSISDSFQNGNVLNENHQNTIEDSTKYIEQITDEVTAHELTSKRIGTEIGFKREIVWSNAIGFLLLHIFGVIGLGVMGLGHARLFTCLYFVVLTILSGMGITMGAHRLFSHRSYKAKTWLKVTLIIMHTMAGQNCLYVWVRDHRQHHKYSDTDADPHNANRGFFFSHVGWLMSKKHPKVIEYGKKIDMSDLEADPWVMFQKRHYKILYTIFTLLLPTAIPCWVWGETVMVSWFATYFARYIVQLNFTWSVNSVAHMFGNKPYDKNLLPVESALVSIVAGGEGWHNYHHTFPWDYRTAELGMPYNLTTKIIDFLASKGSVYDRKTVSLNVLKNRILRTGDGSHEKYGDNVNATSDNNINEQSNSTQDEIDNDAILRKYIVDKNHINKTFLITELEKAAKIDDFNNNENSIKSDQFMNANKNL